MNRRRFNIKILLFLGLLCVVTTAGIGQAKFISLEEALHIARKNYAGLERDRLAVDQQNKLAEAGLPLPPAQLSFSGEEFDFNNQSGIHSINVQQKFYLPKAVNTQRAFYEKGAAVAKKKLAITDYELKQQVEHIYYQLLYAKQVQKLVADNIELYNNFLSFTTAQLVAGETGKTPQLAARFRLGQAQLEAEHAREKYQIALTLFNQWLQSDTLFDVQGGFLFDSNFLIDSVMQNNPHLQVIEAQGELAKAQVETEKSKLLPQIISGLKLQTASGVFPLFGYQVGVNIPLFKKSYRKRIEATEVEVKAQQANLKVEKEKLGRTISELHYRLEHQQHVLEYLQKSLTPIVNEQNEINLIAYGEGEISYLEYLDGLEQEIKVGKQYLAALWEFHTLRIELDYWLGQ